MKYDITFHPSWWHEHCGVDFTEQFFFDPQIRVSEDCRMRKLLHEKFGTWGIGESDPKPRPILGSDLIASGFLYSQLLGCRVKYTPNNPPEVVSAQLDDEAAGRLTAQKICDDPIWQQIEEQISVLKNEFGFVISAINLQGILNIGMDIRGEQLFLDFVLNPDAANHVLEVSYQLTRAIGKRLAEVSAPLSGGVTGIVNKLPFPSLYVNSNCTVEMISQQTYEDFLLNYDKKLAGEFQPYGIHHCGQSMEHVVMGYARAAPLDFAEVGYGSDIAAVRRALKHQHLNLRYSPVRIKEAGKNEMRTEITEMYRKGKISNGGVSISCVGIDAETKDSQIRHFLDICASLEEKH